MAFSHKHVGNSFQDMNTKSVSKSMSGKAQKKDWKDEFSQSCAKKEKMIHGFPEEQSAEHIFWYWEGQSKDKSCHRNCLE